MALTATEEKELKQLKTINSPVPSQKKRMLKLQQLKKIKRKELPKKPKIFPITGNYPPGKFGRPSTKKPITIPDRQGPRTPTEQARIDRNKAIVPNLKKIKLKKKADNKPIIKSTSGSVDLPKKRLKQPIVPKVLKSKGSKAPTFNPNSKTGQYKAPKPKEESTFSSLLKFIRNKLSPSKSISTTEIKKALPSDGTYTDKQIKSLQEALIPSVPFSVNERSKVKPRSSSFKERPPPGKAMPKNNNRKLTQSERILKAKPRPSKKPQLKKPIVSKREQSEIDAGAGKSKPKLKDDRAEFAKAVGNMKTTVNKGTGRSLSKQEKAFADSRGGFKTFAPGKIEKGLATIGGGKMRDAMTSLEDTFYSDIKDRMNKDGGEVSAYEENYVKNFRKPKGGKVSKKKGGMVKRSYGGKVKRNMGGMVSPRKKVVFRRGGGRALRGMGKAIYSNKMY